MLASAFSIYLDWVPASLVVCSGEIYQLPSEGVMNPAQSRRNPFAGHLASRLVTEHQMIKRCPHQRRVSEGNILFRSDDGTAPRPLHHNVSKIPVYDRTRRKEEPLVFVHVRCKEVGEIIERHSLKGQPKFGGIAVARNMQIPLAGIVETLDGDSEFCSRSHVQVLHFYLTAHSEDVRQQLPFIELLFLILEAERLNDEQRKNCPASRGHRLIPFARNFTETSSAEKIARIVPCVVLPVGVMISGMSASSVPFSGMKEQSA